MPLNLASLAVAATVALAVPAFTVGLRHSNPPAAGWLAAETTVEIAPGTVEMPRPGEFLENGRPIAAPLDRIVFREPLRIMKFQVSLADYTRCVQAGACAPPPALRPSPTGPLPVTGVSHQDASAYARWYSEATGESWRLPTAAEWAHAAAERFAGETELESDPGNPAVAWIRAYRDEAARNRTPDPQPKPRGHFGANSNGVEDLSGNVWEWTATCYVRTAVSDDAGAPASRTENCGVRVVEGEHRTYISDFLRDPRSGGCAVGTPPDNLGFRLVLDRGTGPLAALTRIF